MRAFEDKPAVRERVPLLLGLVGPSSSGKTMSAMRLATGMQRVIGGDIFFIDTESRRGLHYADRFKFRHVDFQPPHGPLDYLAAIQHCINRGAKILVIDSMTHEHHAVAEASERFLASKCGDDWKQRERMQMLSWVKPKGERKKLNSEIVRLGINAIFCYRAMEKIKPVKGGEPINLGWQPETTSNLHYDMTARFLLTPGCDGKPAFLPETDAEKRMVKRPEQFRDWFKDGVQLSEEIGERLARWAAGDSTATPPAKPKNADAAALISQYQECQSEDDFKSLEAKRKRLWDTNALGSSDMARLKAASDAARQRVSQPASDEYAGDHTIDVGGGKLFAESTIDAIKN